MSASRSPKRPRALWACVFGACGASFLTALLVIVAVVATPSGLEAIAWASLDRPTIACMLALVLAAGFVGFAAGPTIIGWIEVREPDDGP